MMYTANPVNTKQDSIYLASNSIEGIINAVQKIQRKKKHKVDYQLIDNRDNIMGIIKMNNTFVAHINH